MLGLSLWKCRDYEAAEVAFRAGLRLKGDHFKSHVNLVRVLLDRNRPSEALAYAQRAIVLKPRAAEARRILGRVFHELGQLPDAEAAYRQALALDSAEAWSANNLAFILMQQGRHAEALPLCQRAVRAEGGVALFHNNLGVALEATGHLARALEAYHAAIRIDPSGSNADANLARLEGGTAAAADPRYRASATRGVLAADSIALEVLAEPDTTCAAHMYGLAAAEDSLETDKAAPGTSVSVVPDSTAEGADQIGQSEVLAAEPGQRTVDARPAAELAVGEFRVTVSHPRKQ
jgi:tetratricopeptide (TPR) repeat protein